MTTAVLRQVDGPMFGARYRLTVTVDDGEPERTEFDFPYQADKFLREEHPEIREVTFITIIGKHLTHEVGDWKEPS